MVIEPDIDRWHGVPEDRPETSSGVVGAPALRAALEAAIVGEGETAPDLGPEPIQAPFRNAALDKLDAARALLAEPVAVAAPSPLWAFGASALLALSTVVLAFTVVLKTSTNGQGPVTPAPDAVPVIVMQ